MALAAAVASWVPLSAQSPDWRRIGNTTVQLGLAAPAGGSVSRVWYSPDGQTLYARTATGRTYQSTDGGDKWTPATATPPDSRKTDRTIPTEFNGNSIVGGQLQDVAASPLNAEELTVATPAGVWRSTDNGKSWTGLNESLPNFPASRILACDTGVQLLLTGNREVTWTPGERTWTPAPDSLLAREVALKASVPTPNVTAATRVGDSTYAGTGDGRLLASTDRNTTWREAPFLSGIGQIDRIVTDARDTRFAVAITRTRVLRTVNGGGFWDDITSDLPPGTIRGIATDRITGAVYAASDAGLFMTYTDAVAAAPATPWTRLRTEPAVDVSLDSTGNQLYVAFQDIGIWATLAPHRLRDPRVVAAGDRVLRAVSPGSLLSIIGARIQTATAGAQPATILAAANTESQVQLPWDLPANSVLLQMTSATGNRIDLGLPVAPASPSIFLDRDGLPLVTNAETGLVLDASAPARSGNRIQFLATGLGRVTPDWPAGLAAPLQDAPKVVLPVKAWLDREAVEVTRATLAPGYTGMYLVEIQLPSVVNRGTSELYIEAAGAQSNRVRLWLEP